MEAVAIGDLLGGKYRIDRVLGTGGMGYVALATHVGFDDRVAIKFLHTEYATNADVVARFLREGKAARKIRSEHVVSVTDLGMTVFGLPYLVMEHLEGVDVADLLRTRGAPSIEDAVELILQACEALAEAHALGIVHRDLKPANLFVTTRRDGTPCLKVLDFGISKLIGPDSGSNALTKTSGIMGSPLYMSPEQLQSARDVDARTDIWAIGVILYELVAGKQPFVAESLPQLCVTIMSQPAEPLSLSRPDVPAALAAAIDRCLAKDRAGRYAHVGDLAAAIVAFGPKRARNSAERTSRVVQAAGHTVTRLPISDATAHTLGTGGTPPGPLPPLRVEGVASTTAPISQPDEVLPGISSGRRPLAFLGIVIAAALCFGGIAIWFGRSEPSESRGSPSDEGAKLPPASATMAPATTDETAQPSPPPVTTPAAPPLPSSPPAPSKPMASAPHATPASKVAKPGASVTSATTVTASTATAMSTAAPSVPAKVNCDPPYTIDSKGHKVPKTGCL